MSMATTQVLSTANQAQKQERLQAWRQLEALNSVIADDTDGTLDLMSFQLDADCIMRRALICMANHASYDHMYTRS